MKPIRKIFAAAGILAFAMLACNMPSNAPVQPAVAGAQISTSAPAAAAPAQIDVNTALTLAVQTLQAASTATSAPPTPTTDTTPMVTVSSVTNCRTGPAAAYDLVTSLQVGMPAVVVAKYTPANYWIIKYPGGGNSTCWLWGQYATVVGDTSKLQEAVPPPLPPTPTPVPTAPNAPKSVGLSCSSVNTSHKVGQLFILSAEWPVKLTWKDNSSDEDGFYVYKDGSTVATLGANATSYTDQFSVGLLQLQGSTTNNHTYGVAAYNSYGTSGTKSVDLTSCP
jgi:uncharacterized protein YgiM (DUF1202 family)